MAGAFRVMFVGFILLSGFAVHVAARPLEDATAAIETGEVTSLNDMAESKNTNMTLPRARKRSEEKISLNVRRLVVNLACMAGVRTSRPNFRALWGLTKS